MTRTRETEVVTPGQKDVPVGQGMGHGGKGPRARIVQRYARAAQVDHALATAAIGKRIGKRYYIAPDASGMWLLMEVVS